MEEPLIDIAASPVADVLDVLLQDKTTKKNIIWATDAYAEYGEAFADTAPMDAAALLRRPGIIRPRIRKTQEEQARRTRTKAEVYTPAWLCNRMNNDCDADWFGRPDAFNAENAGAWTPAEGTIQFPPKKDWRRYVDSRRLEIACGEAPYLASRYDASTGEPLFPTVRRIGQLDRKLRAVSENTSSHDDWVKWAVRAVDATYGYDYQGDSVLIARINLLRTFTDCYEERWQRRPDGRLLRRVANRIAWNVWQMDGMTDAVPLGKPYAEYEQTLLFDLPAAPDEREAAPCRITNWRSKISLTFRSLKETRDMKKKKLFDYVIGNPPYQQESVGANESDTPLYHFFYDAAISVSDKVELIHPARFLFNAGATPKTWNEKMLNDPHFKVLMYEQNSANVFPNTDIKGGVAVTYHDNTADFGAIRAFTPFPELNSIKRKVETISKDSLSDVITNRGLYRYSDLAYQEQSEEMTKTADPRIAPSSFERMPKIFTDDKPNDGYEYIQILGVTKGARNYKWIRKDYVKEVENLYKYKVLIPKANGSGAIGEVLSTPLVGVPLVGFTETFISIGETDSLQEVEATLKYVKSKFARTMLGILKVTQNNSKPTWRYVPLQNFTPASDIDWSKSVAEIDAQLYRKYGLDEREVNFIESHVKEMA